MSGGWRKSERVIALFAVSVRNGGTMLFLQPVKRCPDGNRLWDDLLFEGAIQEFHDVQDVLAGFVDFGAGA